MGHIIWPFNDVLFMLVGAKQANGDSCCRVKRYGNIDCEQIAHSMRAFQLGFNIQIRSSVENTRSIQNHDFIGPQKIDTHVI